MRFQQSSKSGTPQKLNTNHQVSNRSSPSNIRRASAFASTSCSPIDVIPVLNRHTLGHVINLVHSDQSRSELKHVVTQRDDDELGILGSFLDVTCDY